MIESTWIKFKICEEQNEEPMGNQIQFFIKVSLVVNQDSNPKCLDTIVSILKYFNGYIVTITCETHEHVLEWSQIV